MTMCQARRRLSVPIEPWGSGWTRVMPSSAIHARALCLRTWVGLEAELAQGVQSTWPR